MSTASRLISYEDSFLLPEDKSAEIVKGELRRMPPPSLKQARLIERLASLLRVVIDERFEVLVSVFGQVIRREPFTYRLPDLGVYLREKISEDHYNWAVPELLVEAISPANRKGDLAELIADYDSLGLPELWLIDVERRRVMQMVREGNGLIEAGDFSDGSVTLRRLNAAVPLAQLWNF